MRKPGNYILKKSVYFTKHSCEKLLQCKKKMMTLKQITSKHLILNKYDSNEQTMRSRSMICLPTEKDADKKSLEENV